MKQPNDLKENYTMRSMISYMFTFLGASFLFSLAFACLPFANLAWATDGRTAVGMCIDSRASGARCEWSVNGKGEIDICNKNGCVTCPSAKGECTKTASMKTHPSGPHRPLGKNMDQSRSRIEGRNKMDKIDKIDEPSKAKQRH